MSLVNHDVLLSMKLVEWNAVKVILNYSRIWVWHAWYFLFIFLGCIIHRRKASNIWLQQISWRCIHIRSPWRYHNWTGLRCSYVRLFLWLCFSCVVWRKNGTWKRIWRGYSDKCDCCSLNCFHVSNLNPKFFFTAYKV